MNEYNICRACIEDLQDILQLQYLAYQSEAALFNKEDIPPLKQTLDEVIEEFNKGVILKMVDAGSLIIGSIRAWELEGTVFIGKLMIHPDYRHHGYGTKLLSEIERYYPRKRYELFTSTRSIDNIRLYQRMGYQEFEHRVVDDNLEFVFMEKEAIFCQSCGMPLTKEILGTNVDGSKNEDYCMYCYKDGRFLQENQITEEKISILKKLNEVAANRGQTLAEMALAWILHDGIVTTVLIGASKPSQILDNIKAIENTTFS